MGRLLLALFTVWVDILENSLNIVVGVERNFLMPKPKTVTVKKQELRNKVTYVTVYLRVCENGYVEDREVGFRKNKIAKVCKDCRIIPYKLRIPKDK